MKSYFGAGPTSSQKAYEAYEKSFADLPHETKYYDPWNGVDMRKDIQVKLLKRIESIRKASIDSQTGGAGTAGYALIPVWVIPGIVDRTRALTPLVELIPRVSNKGLTHDFNVLTAKGGGNWRIEDAALPDDTDTYDRVSVDMKFGYCVGRITGPAAAGWASWGDRGTAFAQDLAVKMRAAKELEEDAIINGDVDTNSEEYDGLIQWISTNTTNLSSTPVTLADIRAEFATTFNAYGYPTLCVTDAATHEYIKGLLHAYLRQPAQPTEGMPFGIPGAFFYGQANFIKSQYMPTTSNSRRILFLDMNYIYMAVLQDWTYEELAKTNDSDKYMMKVYEALVVTYEGACSQIYGIT